MRRIGPRIAPSLHRRSSHTLPVLYAVWAGRVLVTAAAVLGSRRLLQGGVLVAAGARGDGSFQQPMNRAMEALTGRIVKRYRTYERLFEG
jgi:hypothetical protein